MISIEQTLISEHGTRPFTLFVRGEHVYFQLNHFNKHTHRLTGSEANELAEMLAVAVVNVNKDPESVDD